MPLNMDQSTPLDASQLLGLTPPSYMYAFRAWTSVESTAWGIPTDDQQSPGADLYELYDDDASEAPGKRKVSFQHIPKRQRR